MLLLILLTGLLTLLPLTTAWSINMYVNRDCTGNYASCTSPNPPFTSTNRLPSQTPATNSPA